MDLGENTSEVKNNREEEQQARALLREKYLRFVTGLVGSQCTIKTVESTEVSGVFQGIDINGQEILIDNLNTRLGVIKNTADCKALRSWLLTALCNHFNFQYRDLGLCNLRKCWYPNDPRYQLPEE